MAPIDIAYIRDTEAAHAQTAWPWNSSGGNMMVDQRLLHLKVFLCNIGRVFWLYIRVCCLFFASLLILYNFELKETGKSQFYTPSISDLHPHACITWPRPPRFECTRMPPKFKNRQWRGRPFWNLLVIFNWNVWKMSILLFQPRF